MKIIDIGKDFSITPGSRYRSDGRHSAEAFREDILDPAIQKNDLVEVHLDSAMGFGSSFLEEVFGGLIRKHGPGVKNKIMFVTDKRNHTVNMINDFIDEAIVRYNKNE